MVRSEFIQIPERDCLEESVTDVPSRCLASASSISDAVLTYPNCSIAANFGSGCTTNMTNTDSYGPAFAAAGGGIYVAEFTTESIKIWFYSVSQIRFSAPA